MILHKPLKHIADLSGIFSHKAMDNKLKNISNNDKQIILSELLAKIFVHIFLKFVTNQSKLIKRNQNVLANE